MLRQRILVTALLGFALVAPSSAQFAAGSNFAGPSAGLSGVGSTIAVGGHFERAISDRVGWGLFGEYWSYGEPVFSLGSFDVRYIALGGTGAYHFDLEDDKIDPFVGAALGYYIVSIDGTGELEGEGVADSRMFLGGYGGVRYFVKPTLALTARAGFGATNLAIGVDFKF